MRLLLVTAVAAERDAALQRVDPAAVRPADPTTGQGDGGSVLTLVTGIGPVAAGARTARALAHLAHADRVDLVVCAGVAGGFAGRAAVGDVVVGEAATFADLGAATDEGFLDLAALGLDGGRPLPSPAAGRVAHVLATAGRPPCRGEVLTVATMTGTDARAEALAAAHPTAVAEAMEGYGVALAAADADVPWVELRAVSNLVGRRDRSAWDLPAAFAALSTAVAALARPEVRLWEPPRR